MLIKNNRISIDDIIDECKNFYFAGQETTSSLLGWTIFLLATNKEWQEIKKQEKKLLNHLARKFLMQMAYQD